MSQTAPAAKKLKKILIIEDEGDICLLLNIILNGDETEIEHVNSLAKAKEYLDSEKPDIILLDNKLPDGLGIDFISHIRKLNPSSRIVMISGFHAATARDIALANGADVFLEKPFTREQLCKSIEGSGC